MTIYRSIYEQNFGPIPIDDFGRTYEIHHIDGNHQNNNISNLKCVSIQEHYDIHYSQGDYQACVRIASRMNKSKKEISELATKSNDKRLKNKTHNFLSGEPQRKNKGKKVYHDPNTKQCKRFFPGEQPENWIHGNADISGNNHWNYGKKVIFSDSTKELLKKEQKRRVNLGTHNFMNYKMVSCPHCGLTGKGPNMKRYHFDNCKLKN